MRHCRLGVQLKARLATRGRLLGTFVALVKGADIKLQEPAFGRQNRDAGSTDALRRHIVDLSR